MVVEEDFNAQSTSWGDSCNNPVGKTICSTVIVHSGTPWYTYVYTVHHIKQWYSKQTVGPLKLKKYQYILNRIES